MRLHPLVVTAVLAVLPILAHAEPPVPANFCDIMIPGFRPAQGFDPHTNLGDLAARSAYKSTDQSKSFYYFQKPYFSTGVGSMRSPYYNERTTNAVIQNLSVTLRPMSDAQHAAVPYGFIGVYMGGILIADGALPRARPAANTLFYGDLQFTEAGKRNYVMDGSGAHFFCNVPSVMPIQPNLPPDPILLSDAFTCTVAYRYAPIDDFPTANTSTIFYQKTRGDWRVDKWDGGGSNGYDRSPFQWALMRLDPRINAAQRTIEFFASPYSTVVLASFPIPKPIANKSAGLKMTQPGNDYFRTEAPPLYANWPHTTEGSGSCTSP